MLAQRVATSVLMYSEFVCLVEMDDDDTLSLVGTVVHGSAFCWCRTRLTAAWSMMMVDGCFPVFRAEGLSVSATALTGMDKCALLTIEGSISSAAAATVREAGLKAISAGYIYIVFIMKEGRLGHGLGPFCSILNTLRPVDGRIAIVSLRKDELEAFRYSGWDSAFLTGDSLSEVIGRLPGFIVSKEESSMNDMESNR